MYLSPKRGRRKLAARPLTKPAADTRVGKAGRRTALKPRVCTFNDSPRVPVRTQNKRIEDQRIVMIPSGPDCGAEALTVKTAGGTIICRCAGHLGM